MSSTSLPEEAAGGAAVDDPVLDVGLGREVLGRLYRLEQGLGGEGGGQVGSVGGNHDQGEEVEHTNLKKINWSYLELTGAN